MNQVALKPSYWASVSGGKDSLFMLNLILHNLDKYPLNGVVHFELEIDYPFIKNVIDYMECECKRFGIPFLRLKPRTSWYVFYKDLGFPARNFRWCNSKYKLDGKKQLESFLKEQGYFCVHYIGFCADEVSRFRKSPFEVYPLANEGIYERDILEWAKEVSLFNDYYKINARCGCMYCPLSSRMTFAYLAKYYPSNFEYMIGLMRKTELDLETRFGHKFSIITGNPKYNADYLHDIILNKWVPRLEKKLLLLH